MGEERGAVTPTRARTETITGGQVAPAPYGKEVSLGHPGCHQPPGATPASNRTPRGLGLTQSSGELQLMGEGRHKEGKKGVLVGETGPAVSFNSNNKGSMALFLAQAGKASHVSKIIVIH